MRLDIRAVADGIRFKTTYLQILQRYTGFGLGRIIGSILALTLALMWILMYLRTPDPEYVARQIFSEYL